MGTKAKKEKTVSKIVKVLWGLFFLAVISIAVIFFSLSNSDLPDFEVLENPQSSLATEVYASDGTVLGRYFVENRVAVDYSELSPLLVDALLATEDARFRSHSGIDFRALARVVGKTVLMGQSSSGGGSTITQQLAKLLFDRPSTTGNSISRAFQLVSIKLKEWIVASRLERQYTKNEIIAMYLNHFNFINGAYGVKAASEIYFGKNQKDLNVEEAALLIGMLKNPSLYNPNRFPERSQDRREVVLNQMVRADMLTSTEYDSLREIPLDMSRFKRSTHSEGPAPYFRQELTKWLNKLLDGDEYKKSDGSQYNIYRDGLKVYTTIDPIMQQHAEASVQTSMENVQNRYWKTWKKKDPWTHDAGENEKEMRQNQLTKLMRGSDRYAGLRDVILQPVIDKINKNLDAYSIQDFDIDRMLKEEKKAGHLKQLVARKLTTRKKASFYKDVMSSADWKELKTAWTTLQDRADKLFNTPTKMTVFIHGPQQEKDTVMTPWDSIRYHRMHLQTGFLAIEPSTGYIKAWVGGINHKYFKYDHINSDRQVGSTFKPFIYSTAITMQGISPCFKVDDQPYTIAPGDGNFGLIDEWAPNNADGEFSYERLTLYEGLKKSLNSVSVYLMQQLGDAALVRDLVHNMGIDKDEKRADGEYRIPRQPSIALGAADLNVLEMTGAYTTFANNGVYSEPIFVTRIEDKNGKLLYRSTSREEQALPANVNYVMVDMLKYAQQNQAKSRGIKTPFGGKTGTTNDYVDGWFMGITPNLVMGTWVGGDDTFIRFLSLANGQGSRMARPTVHDFMKRIEADKELAWDTNVTFEKPSGDLGIIIDCEEYENLNWGIPTVPKDPDENPFIEENKSESEEDDDGFFEG